MRNFEFYRKKFVEKQAFVIIPTYNNCKTLGSVLDKVLNYTSQVVVVNDGSTDETSNILDKYKGIDIISLQKNMGKGNALQLGFEYGISKNYKYAITIDSDGQHMPEELPLFIDKLEDMPDAVIIGSRNMDQDSVPGKSSFGNKFSNFWFYVETGIKLPDTQSGFRLYPIERLKNIKFYTKKFEFETEVIVRAAWKSVKVTSIPVRVCYAKNEERISHFRPFKDFSRISVLNTILTFLALVYYRPLLFIRNFTKEKIKEFFQKNLFETKDSNVKLSLSILLGIFMSIAPIWGFQLIAAIALAYIFRLNRIIVVIASNISITPMIPIILYLSYVTGGLVLGNSVIGLDFNSGITFEFLKDNLIQYIIGSIVFGAALAITCGLTTYFVLLIFRKNHPEMDNQKLSLD